MNFLKGRKTYIIMIVGIILNGCIAMNVIPQEYFPLINAVLGMLGLGTLRAGISNTKEVK